MLLLATAMPDPAAAAQGLHDTIRDVQRKVVKIYGAGGLRGLEAYQSGILISADGQVLTVQSYVLDTEDVAVVLDDGRKYPADVLGVDPVRELALLKLRGEDLSLPHFELAAATVGKPGERVLAASNLFGIAAGDEPVSVLQGVISTVAPLEARRGAFEAAFRGDVYIVDAAANNPGASGGALVNWRGQLLGILGKEVRHRSTGAWLNYALPVDQFIGSVETLISGGSGDAEVPIEADPEEPLSPADLGLVLVPDILPRTPPYIDTVLPDSPAAAAGLRVDDLVVFIEGEPTVSCSAVTASLARRERFDAVRVSVMREGRLIECLLEPAPSEAGDAQSPAIDGATSRPDPARNSNDAGPTGDD